MTETEKTDTKPTSSGSISRIVSGFVGIASLVAACLFAVRAEAALTSGASSTLFQTRAPALIGLPIAILLATGLVCGARALNRELRFELLGLKVDGGAADLICWAVIVLTLVLALRTLW